ncbi:MAG: hypothetical protein HKL81_05110 [Acidimicrobiaceae bacterium]|nr:hypothetical protein [Acidimicrobiaceae bacterium]
MNDANNTPGVDKLQRLESEIQTLLEKAEEEGQCESWEIDEIALIDRRSYGIKVGIYPWGKTIMYGTAADIRKAVKDIIRSTAMANLQCPFCGFTQPMNALSTPHPTCQCGTRFFVRGSWSPDAGITKEDCWGAIKQALLRAGATDENVLYAIRQIEANRECSLNDMFSGACTMTVLNTVVHAIRPDAAPLERSSLPKWIVLSDILLANEFIRIPGSDENTESCFEGSLLDEPVTVALAKNDCEIVLGIDESPSRLYSDIKKDNDDDEWELQDMVTDEWLVWTCGVNPARTVLNPEWTVMDGYLSSRADEWYALSASYSGAVPDNPDDEWLLATLEKGVEACIETSDEFLQWLDLPKRRQALKAEKEAAKAALNQSSETRLKDLCAGDLRLLRLLDRYVRSVGTPQPSGWHDLPTVQTALAVFEDPADCQYLINSPLAASLWSKRLRSHLRRSTQTDGSGG